MLVMRHRFFLNPLLGLALSFIALFPAAGGDKHARNQKFREWLSVLSNEDRAKYRAARKQALLNPEVRAANERRRKMDEDYRHLLHAEMLRLDPSVKPIIEKAEELERHADY